MSGPECDGSQIPDQHSRPFFVVTGTVSRSLSERDIRGRGSCIQPRDFQQASADFVRLPGLFQSGREWDSVARSLSGSTLTDTGEQILQSLLPPPRREQLQADSADTVLKTAQICQATLMAVIHKNVFINHPAPVASGPITGWTLPASSWICCMYSEHANVPIKIGSIFKHYEDVGITETSSALLQL